MKKKKDENTLEAMQVEQALWHSRQAPIGNAHASYWRAWLEACLHPSAAKAYPRRGQLKQQGPSTGTGNQAELWHWLDPSAIGVGIWGVNEMMKNLSLFLNLSFPIPLSLSHSHFVLQIN